MRHLGCSGICRPEGAGESEMSQLHLCEAWTSKCACESVLSSPLVHRIISGGPHLAAVQQTAADSRAVARSARLSQQFEVAKVEIHNINVPSLEVWQHNGTPPTLGSASCSGIDA